MGKRGRERRLGRMREGGIREEKVEFGVFFVIVRFTVRPFVFGIGRKRFVSNKTEGTLLFFHHFKRRTVWI